MLVISHRGFHEIAPENTLAAFEAAQQLGVDGIETDVRVSADGHAILYHDRHVRDGREVASLTRDELAELGGFGVPTLQEALASFPDLFWILEVKTTSAVDATARALEAFEGSRRCLVISFWHEVVHQLVRRVPVRGGLLMSHCPLDSSGFMTIRPGSRDASTLVWNFEFVSARLVHLAARRGYLNYAYGAETAAEALRAAAMGLDGLILDDPRPLLSLAASPFATGGTLPAEPGAAGELLESRPPPPGEGVPQLSLPTGGVPVSAND